MKISFTWLKEFVAIKDSPQTLAQRLTMAGVEVEAITKSGRDTLLEIAAPPNRGDLLGHDGVAREVAAVLRLNYKPKKFPAPRGSGKIRSRLTVIVKDRNRAPRYMVRMISGVKVGPSPAWLKDRLEEMGLRSINNVVDVTNHVMLELGQPLHAFDFDHLREHCLTIQTPPSPMRMRALDGVEYSLTTEDLCIMDSGGPVAIAGIMGGQNSSVTPATTTIVLESAYFLPSTVRRSSRRLGLSTDSSRRFERSVDPDTVDRALHRATQLIVELAGGTPSADWIDFYQRKVIPARITFAADTVNQVLGTDLKAPQIAKYLTSIGCQLRPKSAGKWQVVMPASRPDLTRAIDLVEEVIRLHGFEEIPTTVPMLPSVPTTEPAMRHLIRRSRELLAGSGLCESIHYGFEPLSQVAWANLKSTIAIRNPLGNESTILRSELVPGLLNAVAYNLCHRTMQGGLFEIRKVFAPPTAGNIPEATHLGITLFGTRGALHWTGGKEPVDLYDIKGILDRLVSGLGLPALKFASGSLPGYVHPKNAALVTCGGQTLGWVGMVHPQITQTLDLSVACAMAELNFEKILPLVEAVQLRCKPLARFPGVRRDLALLVDVQRTAEEIETVLRKAGGKLLTAVTAFDVYQGKNIPSGKKSIAFALHYQDPDETLTFDAVDKVHETVVKVLSQQLGAVIR